MSSETVKLIRKLRWLGLEEKAEQLEDELEQQAATDTVVSIQVRLINTALVQRRGDRSVHGSLIHRSPTYSH